MDEEFWMYYSAGSTHLADSNIDEPLHLGLGQLTLTSPFGCHGLLIIKVRSIKSLKSDNIIEVRYYHLSQIISAKAPTPAGPWSRMSAVPIAIEVKNACIIIVLIITIILYG